MTSKSKISMGLVTLLFLSALAWAFGTLPGRYWTSYLGLTSDLHLRSRLVDSSEAVATLQTWRWDADFEVYLLGQANNLLRLSHELERAEEQVFENLQAHLPDWEPLQQEPLSRLLGKVQQILSSSHNLYLEAWLNEPLSLGEMLEMALASGQGSLSALLPSFAGVIELRSKAPLLSSLGISHISEILDQRLLLKDGESLGPMGKAQLQEILSGLELESHKVQGAPFVRIRHQEWGLTAYAYLPDRRHLAFGSQPELVLSFVDKIKSSPLRGSLAETSSIELFVDVQKFKERLPLLNLLPFFFESVRFSSALGPQSSLSAHFAGVHSKEFFEGHSEALQKTLQELSGVYYLESEDDELTLRAQLPLDGALAKLTEKLRERIRRSQAQKEVLHSVQDKAGGQPAVVFSGEDVGVLLGEVSGEGEAFLRAALGDPKIYYEMEAHLTTSQAPQFLIFSGHCANAPSRLELTQAGRRLPLFPKDADQISQDFELKREPSAAYVFKLPPTLRSGPAQLLWHVSTQGEPQDVRTGSCRLDFPPFVL